MGGRPLNPPDHILPNREGRRMDPLPLYDSSELLKRRTLLSVATGLVFPNVLRICIECAQKLPGVACLPCDKMPGSVAGLLHIHSMWPALMLVQDRNIVVQLGDVQSGCACNSMSSSGRGSGVGMPGEGKKKRHLIYSGRVHQLQCYRRQQYDVPRVLCDSEP